jgi:hypothetical protein
VLERAAEPTFAMAVEMHSRHRWLVHREVAATVDLLLRGQSPRPEIRELGADGHLLRRELAPLAAPAPARPGTSSVVTPILGSGLRGGRPLAAVPLPDPFASPSREPQLAPPQTPAPMAAPAPLRLCALGLPPQLLQEALRSSRLPAEVVAEPELADAVLSLRGELGRDPELRRRAQALGLPILVIKSDSLHQLQRAIQRLLERRQPPLVPEALASGQRLDDDHGALEECRLAVEQVVLPQGRPVELLPRSDRVRRMQEDLVRHYRLRSAVFGRGAQQRLRVFPP